ncbi:MAG: dockerin type I repeat-containing protein [Puniceicoccaceae bacterium]
MNLGDLDGDGQPTIKDIVLLVNHLQGSEFLETNLVPFADVNRDSYLNTYDVQSLTDIILERNPFTPFPLLQVAAFSPTDGEENVSLSREAIARFSLPLAEDTVLTTDHFAGYFAGKKLLSRVELSQDRLKATLFFQENLPSSARIRVVFDGTGVFDYLGRELDPDGDGQAGGTAFMDFDTCSIAGLPGTSVQGVVYTAELGPNYYKVPLEGVIIEVIGAEETIRTTTGPDGRFVLENTPAGRFFVNLDGRQAKSNPPAGFTPIQSDYPNGDYYPFIAKPWFAVAGRTDNLVNGNGEVFLPLVRQGSLTTVSATQSTEITFPASVLNAVPAQGVPRDYDPEDLQRVSLTIPPNALFSNDGSRGGAVGIAPVVPDRLPEPLPEGLNPAMVITVQTDGATNFDVPIPVRFPNLPDPVTGERLQPGEKSSLWSFNHDKGTWEIAGPMTVSDDGLYVVSDPGTGIRQPGWHPTQPGTQTRTKKNGSEDEDEDEEEDDDEEDDEPCDETGTETEGEWICKESGAVTQAGSFPDEEMEICSGDSVSAPTITGTEISDGKKERTISNNFVCPENEQPDRKEVQTVSYTPEYVWLPEDPSSASFDRGGTYTFTCEVRGKGDGDCPDTASVAVAGTFTVNVIEIPDISFSPEEIPPDGESTSMAATSVNPDDKEIVWSIEGDAKGCTIDPETGKVTAGEEAGSVTVRASVPGTDCYTEASLCVGGDCCPDKNGTLRFGPLKVSLPGNIVSTGEEGDYCIYSTPAEVTVEMKGVFEKSGALEGTTVSWKEHKSTGAFKDVTVEWEGKKDLGKFGVIQANVTAASLTVSDSGDLSGDLTFTVEQTEDVNVGGIAILKKDLTGQFKYSYMLGQAGFAGAWDFQGITNILIELRKGDVVIGKISAESFDSEGNINNARFSANTPGTYTTKGFSVTLEQLDLGMNYSIPNSEIEFIDGTGRIRIADVTNVDGEFILELAFTPTTVTATVGAEGIMAFGMTISGALRATVTYDFDLEGIEGVGISGKHNDFDQSFTNITFRIRDGSVEEFTVEQIRLKYKQKIEFSFSRAVYSKAEGTLQFDAMVSLPTLELAVKTFKIDDKGNVSVGELSGSVDQSPVTFEISITFAETEFRGNFSGQFAKKVSIRGEIVIGATETFNYGFFSLAVSTPGFPLGQSGLKIKSLAGEFGYNWEAPTQPGGTGQAVQGSLTIGFGLGIADVGDLALLEGYARLILGAATTIQLEGSVKVTANAPHIFQGDLNISYTLGSEMIQGDLNSTINIPPGDGGILRLNSGSIRFAISASRYTVNGENATGQILDVVDVRAGINVSAPLTSSGSVSGRVFGRFDYEGQFNYTYPDGFNSSSCDEAIDTSTWYGFGIDGQLTIQLFGALNANFDSRGFTGTIRASVGGTSTVRVKWPCLVCGDDCVSVYSVTASGNVDITDNGSNTRIRGTVTISAGGESESAEIDEYI